MLLLEEVQIKLYYGVCRHLLAVLGTVREQLRLLEVTAILFSYRSKSAPFKAEHSFGFAT